jgi:uncharacterized membrane protein YdbT with pleckstrin-like domain
MEDNKQPVVSTDEYKFRPNKNLFIMYIIMSVLLLWLIIGIPLLVSTILWYKFSYIVLGKQGIHLHKGWLNVTDKQVPYEKVNTVESQQSIFDRMFGCGQLKIFTGNDIQGIAFYGIDSPAKAKQLIEDRVHNAVSNISNIQPQSQSSPADELVKYAALREKGIITQEEFDSKKKQLLG